MNELITIAADGQPVTSSRTVAENFHLEHKHVVQNIDALKSKVHHFEQRFFETEIPDSFGEMQKAYTMNRVGFAILSIYLGSPSKEKVEQVSKFTNAFYTAETELKNKSLPQNITNPAVSARRTSAALADGAGEPKGGDMNEALTKTLILRLLDSMDQLEAEVKRLTALVDSKQEEIDRLNKDNKWLHSELETALHRNRTLVLSVYQLTHSNEGKVTAEEEKSGRVMVRWTDTADELPAVDEPVEGYVERTGETVRCVYDGHIWIYGEKIMPRSAVSRWKRVAEMN